MALALTLAKRPRLLVRDEPVAALDPLARRQFLAHLAEAVADSDLTSTLGEDFRSRLVASLPVRLVATPKMARRYRGFPEAAGEMPVLLRRPENPIRKELLELLQRKRVRTTIAAETEDSDLIRLLALE